MARNNERALDNPDQWGEDVQRVLLSFMISDPTSFALSRSIIEPDYFEDNLRPAIRMILDYADKYRAMPTPEQVEAMGRVRLDVLDPESIAKHSQWYLDSIEQFCKYRALELAVLDGIDLLQKGQGGEVERRVKEAMTISLVSDLGTDYFADPKARLEKMRDKSAYISTGWKVLDDKLYGGFTRGALNIFAGGSGCVVAGTKVRVIRKKKI
jgi:hypothetical protein